MLSYYFISVAAIVIEDFKGNTNQVYLEPGDILFYESSKILSLFCVYPLLFLQQL